MHLWRSLVMILMRRRFHFLLVLLVLPLLLGAKANTDKEHVICREGFMEVVSPDPLSVDQCKAAAKMVMAAWEFDLNVMRWANPAEVQRPLTLRLLSAERIKKEAPGLRAFASWNGKYITMNTELIDARSGPLTLAHELGHIQAARVVGERWGKQAVPLYFIEGHGLFMNVLYSDHLRISSPDKKAPQNVRALMSLSAQEAQVILTDGDRYCNHYKDPDKTFKMEAMGLYFVEYMRTRYRGNGIQDTVPKMGRVFELVGRGKTYEQAFKQVYGISVNETVSEIVALFKRTEANPAERYKGTSFEVTSQVVDGKSQKGSGGK